MSLVKVHLLTWEKNPRMRGANNEISFLVDNSININMEDILHSTELDGESLTYRILKINHISPSSMEGMDYARVNVKCLRKNRDDRNESSKEN